MRILETSTGSEIRLTGEEFIAILKKHFGCDISGFVILNPDPSPMGKIVRQAVINPLDKKNFVGNIKSLRETVESIGKYLTLAEARWAIENWNEWLQFVDRKNQLPMICYDDGDNGAKLK
jgi:GGDEF domain-containing protein